MPAGPAAGFPFSTQTMSETKADISEDDTEIPVTIAGNDETTSPDSDEQVEANSQDCEQSEELDPLEKAQAEVEEWKDRAMRRQAELENFRKRSAREKSEAIRYANGSLLGELFPILDNFDMGLQAALQESEDSIISKGMQMVQQQMHDFLDASGVTIIDSVGETFDPNVHEAVSQEASDEVPEGHVISVIRKGYRLHDRLLRAANVVVSTGSAPAETETEADDEGAAEEGEE